MQFSIAPDDDDALSLLLLYYLLLLVYIFGCLYSYISAGIARGSCLQHWAAACCLFNHRYKTVMHCKGQQQI